MFYNNIELWTDWYKYFCIRRFSRVQHNIPNIIFLGLKYYFVLFDILNEIDVLSKIFYTNFYCLYYRNGPKMAEICTMLLDPDDMTVGLTVGETILYCYN